MIQVERVDFVSIPTRDVERAKRFYGETLGLSSNAQTPGEFEAGNLTLGLWAPEQEGLPFEPSTAGIALRVQDVAAARAQLEEAGVQFVAGIADTGVCHMSAFYDPDGNVLILHRRYAA